MKKVLFVEDEPDHIAMLKTRIESQGYIFLSALDGEEGLNLALEQKPDIILLDVIMPNMNGYEMTYLLKQNDEMKDIPIIIITASGAKKLEQKCIEMGVQEVIHKPYDSAYLMERLSYYLGN